MIYFMVINQKWEAGKRLGLKKYNDFEKWLADLYVKKLVSAIDDERYKQVWPPLSAKYFMEKVRKGLSLKMWEATSDLKNHLYVKNTKKKGARITVGFNKTLKHKTSGLPYEYLCQILEYGSILRKIPPRPLFRTVLKKMQGRLKLLYKVFNMQKTNPRQYTKSYNRELRNK